MSGPIPYRATVLQPAAEPLSDDDDTILMAVAMGSDLALLGAIERGLVHDANPTLPIAFKCGSIDVMDRMRDLSHSGLASWRGITAPDGGSRAKPFLTTRGKKAWMRRKLP
jgi:hypothetical protein